MAPPTVIAVGSVHLPCWCLKHRGIQEWLGKGDQQNRPFHNMWPDLGSFFVRPSPTERQLDGWRMPPTTSAQLTPLHPHDPRLSFPTKRDQWLGLGSPLALRSEARKSALSTVIHPSTGGAGGGLVAKSCLTPLTPGTILHQAPLSMGFSRQDYCSELPFPPPGDLPSWEIKAESRALTGRFFALLSHWGSRNDCDHSIKKWGESPQRSQEATSDAGGYYGSTGHCRTAFINSCRRCEPPL